MANETQKKNQNNKRLLGRLPDVGRGGVFESLPRSAKIWQRHIKRRIPVDTGKLKRNFRFHYNRRMKTFVIDYGDAAYGPFVESGFARHYIPQQWIQEHRSGNDFHEWVENPTWVDVQKTTGRSHFIIPGLRSGTRQVANVIGKRVREKINEDAQ